MSAMDLSWYFLYPYIYEAIFIISSRIHENKRNLLLSKGHSGGGGGAVKLKTDIPGQYQNIQDVSVINFTLTLDT